MTPAVGSVWRLDIEGLYVDVHVLQTRAVFGRVDALVAPVRGAGEKWISAHRLRVREEER